MMTYAELDYLNAVKMNLPKIANQLEIQNKIELYKIGCSNPNLGIDCGKLITEIKKSIDD